jgi:hypothetical protein
MNMFGNNTASGPGTNYNASGSPMAPASASGECKKQYVMEDSSGKLSKCTPPSSVSNLFGLLGGRKRSIKRGGSFSPNTDLGVASTASSFSGGRTAQPHNWTGGKRRRRSSKRRTRRLKCNKCSKRRRHRH